MSSSKILRVSKKSLSLFLAVVMLLSCIAVTGVAPAAFADTVGALSVSLADADDVDDGKIRPVVEDDTGTLHFSLSLSEGTTPQVGAKITDLPAPGPAPLSGDVEGAVPGQWLRVYDVDASGNITGYGAVQITWDKIGNRMATHSGGSPFTTSFNLGNDTWTDYIVEWSMKLSDDASGWVSTLYLYFRRNNAGNQWYRADFQQNDNWIPFFVDNQNWGNDNYRGGWDYVPGSTDRYITYDFRLVVEGNDIALWAKTELETSYTLRSMTVNASSTAPQRNSGGVRFEIQGTSTTNITDVIVRSIRSAPTGTPVTDVTIGESGTTLSANVTPDEATVMYEWSIEDETLGSVILGTGAALLNAPLDEEITLTVLGTGTYTGTQSRIRSASSGGGGGEYTVTVTNGTSDKATADASDEVTVTAGTAAPGKVFDKWEATGITLTPQQEATNPLTFTMPAVNVSFTATYKDSDGPPSVPGGTPGTGSEEFPRPTATRTFYIDGNAATNGDGSEGSPWNTLAPIGGGGGHTVQAGDHFYIKAGSIFQGTNARITTDTNGTAAAPIVVDMYDPDDTGVKPVINGYVNATNTGTLVAINRDYWEFRNLKLTWWDGSTFDGISGTRQAFGISGGRNHVYILDCDVYNMDSNKSHTTGIGVANSGVTKDLVIAGNTFIGVSRTALRIAGGSNNNNMNWQADLSHETAMETNKTTALIKNNFFDRIGGDVFINDYTYGTVFEYNTALRACHDLPQVSTGNPGENMFSAGIWGWHSVNAIYQYNEVAYIRDGGVGDRSAFDFDSNCTGYTVFQYNYTHHNSGGQMLYCAAGRTASDNNPGSGYIQDTRIIRYNVSAFESVSCGPSDTAELTFVYNNIYYKSTPGRTNAAMNQGWDTNIYDDAARSSGEPWDDWAVSPLGHMQNMTFGNYIFNNIFYECERITINSATSFSNGGRNFTLIHTFNNNIVYNTPIYQINNTTTPVAEGVLTGSTGLIRDNILANPKFLGDIDPRNADGFAVLEALRVAHDSPAKDNGITIPAMLSFIEEQIGVANAAAGGGRWALNYAHINQRVFDYNISRSIAPTVDFFGNPVDATSNFIGIAAPEITTGLPLILDLDISPRRIVMEHDEDLTDYTDDVTVTVTGENLVGNEVLTVFGKEFSFTSGTPITIDLSDSELDLTVGLRHYASVEAADGSLMKISWMGLFQEEPPYVEPIIPGLILNLKDDAMMGTVSVKSAHEVGDPGDNLYYVLAMSEGTRPEDGANISDFPTAALLTIGAELEVPSYEDFWLRIYTANSSGLITDFASAQIKWANVGNLLHRSQPGRVVGNGQFVAIGDEEWSDYRLEFDMQRVSGSGTVNFYFHHLGTGSGSGSSWWRIPITLSNAGDWYDLGSRTPAGTERSGASGWWHSFMEDPEENLHYRIVSAGNNRGNTSTAEEWDIPAMYTRGVQFDVEPVNATRAADGSRQYSFFGSAKGNYGAAVTGITSGKTGYSIPTGTTVDLYNWSIHKDLADTYASRTPLPSTGVGIAALAAKETLFAVTPDTLQVAYEWSYEDADLGSVVLGYDWQLEVPTGVDADDVILTVAGMGTHKGTVVVNTIDIVTVEPDDPAKALAEHQLEEAITTAKGLTQNDYMAAGWSNLQTAIGVAEDILTDAANKTAGDLDDARGALELVVGALVETYTVTFNAGGGSVSPASARVRPDGTLASWPTPTNADWFTFDGWFAAASGGTALLATHVFTGNTTVFAQWEQTGEPPTITGGGPPNGNTINTWSTPGSGQWPNITIGMLDYILEFDVVFTTNNTDFNLFLRRANNTDTIPQNNNQLNIRAGRTSAARFQETGNQTFTELAQNVTHRFRLVVQDTGTSAYAVDVYVNRNGTTEWVLVGTRTATGANYRTGIELGFGFNNLTAQTISNIVAYEIGEIVTDPREELEGLVQTAEGLLQNDYMAAQWGAFTQALEAAQTLLLDALADEGALEQAYTDLDDAMKALVQTYTVTFNPQGGTVDPTTARVRPDGTLASWPTADRGTTHEFDGWFAAASGGTALPTSHVFTGNTTVHAQWTEAPSSDFPGIPLDRTEARSFYIDSIGGSDDNPGTEALPLKTLGFISTNRVLPGDKFFLKAGSIFMAQNIRPLVSGADGKPVVVDSYGSGPKPVINPQGMTPTPNEDNISLNNDRGMNGGYLAAVDLQNISYWEFRNLHISNFDPTLNNGIAHNTTQPTFNNNAGGQASATPPNNTVKRLGFVVSADNPYWDYWGQSHTGGMGSNSMPNDLTSRAGVWPLRDVINPETGKPYKDLVNYRHIYIIGCDIHDIDGNQSEKDNGGIIFLLQDEDVKYSHVRIENNSLRRINRMGLQMAYNWVHEFYFHGSDTDPHPQWANGKLTEWEMGDEADYYSNDIIIRNNFFDEIGGDGIDLTMTVGALVEYNTLYRMCHTLPTANNALGRPSDGHFSAGVWTWSSRDAMFQFNEVAFIRDGGTGDKSAFDFDSQNTGYTIYQYNYTHHNAGGQLLTCSVGREENYTMERYYLDTRIVRYNVSAYEPLAQGQSNSTTSGFLYNNVYYKSINDTRPIFDSVDPMWHIQGMGTNAGDSVLFSNYVFNNIFYEGERITIDNNTVRSHSSRNFVLHSLFTNNLIIDTPVRLRTGGSGTDLTKAALEAGGVISGANAYVDMLNGNTVMTVAEFEAAGGFVGEILPGLDARGWEHVYEVMVPETNTAAVGQGISIADVLTWIETDMTRANNAATTTPFQGDRGRLIYSELDMRPFLASTPTLPTDLNMDHLVITEDIAGNPINEVTPNIGVGIVPAAAISEADAFRSAHATVLSLTEGTVAIGNKTAVQNAQSAFDLLSGGAKALLLTEDSINAAFFTELLAKIAELEDELEVTAFKSAHATVLSLTEGTVAIGNKTAVQNAQSAFDLLSGGAKAVLLAEDSINAAFFTELLAKIAELEDEQAAAAFKSAHAAVLSLTEGTVAIGNKTAVQNAQSAYNGLSAGVKEVLLAEDSINAAFFTELLAKIAELEALEDEDQPLLPPIPPPTEPEPEPDPEPEDPTPVELPPTEATVDEDGVASAEIDEKELNDAIDELLELLDDDEDGVANEIVITVNLPDDVTLEDVESVEAVIPSEAVQRMAEETTADLTVVLAEVAITFDHTAVETIAAGAGEEEEGVVISAALVAAADIPEEYADIIGDRPVFEFSVTNGGSEISFFGGGYATVSIPYELRDDDRNPNAIIVYYINSDGNLVVVRGHYDSETKSVIIRTGHFSQFAIGYNYVKFDDVDGSHPNYDAIVFIAAREITAGIGDNLFGPEYNLTRAELLVLIMKAFGIDVEEGLEDYKFDDVEGTWYDDWTATARKLGITAGIGDNQFGANEAVTREQMLLMVYNTLKAIGELPETEDGITLGDFADADSFSAWVDADGNADKIAAVLSWGVYAEASLNPQDSYERALMAQMLYLLLIM
ncbi:MAG: S-layer homology domain-containing protein [Oscillospiraceae bacterium]|nr:S-layer homology domain-containing protein [Oscillospiraceae bacterium]